MVKYQKSNIQLTAVMSAVCTLSVIVMIITAVWAAGRNDRESLFVPPGFDSNAMTGLPEVPENLPYAPIEVEQGYTMYLLAELHEQDGAADIYFTSPETNTMWLMLRVIDHEGKVLGETGIICPGEYVKSIAVSNVSDTETNVKLKVIAFQPETYISMGSVSLNTVIIPID